VGERGELDLGGGRGGNWGVNKDGSGFLWVGERGELDQYIYIYIYIYTNTNLIEDGLYETLPIPIPIHPQSPPIPFHFVPCTL
jgi:hypothetical protein